MRAILMFHGVDDSGSVLSVSPKQLASLVRAVRASGHQLVPLRDLLDHRSNDRAVAVTFDDGFASVAEHAAPIFRAEGVPATLFVTTGYVGRDNAWPGQSEGMPRVPLMGWDAIERLYAAGWSIDAHSVSHPDLRRLDDDALEEELVRPREELARRLGRKSEILAYPYGYYDQRVLDVTRRHYRYAVTAEMRALAADPPLRVPRLDAYYLRSFAVHRRFGTKAFAAWVAGRRALRRMRGHPGEIR